MSGAEVFVIGAVIGGVTNLLTDGINPLLQITRTAMRCKEECRKLELVMESIKKDVQHIKDQLEELQSYDPNAKQDLRMVVNSVEKLKGELHLADIEVHECDTASRIGKKLGGYRLSRKITAHNEKITALAKDLVPVNVQLTNMLKDARSSKCPSMDLQQRLLIEMQHRASMELQQQPSMELQQWNREKNDILQREDTTRLSQRLLKEYSVHSGSGSSSPSLYAEDSSQHSSYHLNHTDPSQYHRSNTVPAHHVTHSEPQYHRSYTTHTQHHVTHSEPLYHRSYTTQSQDHVTHSEGIQVRLQDPFIPHLLL